MTISKHMHVYVYGLCDHHEWPLAANPSYVRCRCHGDDVMDVSLSRHLLAVAAAPSRWH